MMNRSQRDDRPAPVHKTAGTPGRFRLLLDNPRPTMTTRSLYILTRMSFALFLVICLLIPVTFSVMLNNRLDGDSAKYKSIVSVSLERENLRGSIYDRNGKILAETLQNEDGSTQRKLYYKESLAHVIGAQPGAYYGSEGAEVYFNQLLVGLKKKNIDAQRGDNVYLTVDVNLQELLYTLLEGTVGAAVLTDCKTGELLAMVSTPSYDPSVSYEEATQLYQNGEYVNNAVASLTPGSVFKLVSAAVLTDNDALILLDNDGGQYTYQGLGTIANYGDYAYTNVDVYKAIQKSSNVWFSRAAMELITQKSMDTYISGIEALGIGSAVQTQFGKLVQSHGITANDTWELLQSSFGQGKLLLSPMYMNIFVSAAVTDGKMRVPYMLLRSVGPDNKTSEEGKAQKLDFTVSEAACAVIKQGMLQAGNDYGLLWNGQPGSVYAKTGTAEISDVRNNIWLTSSFPAEDPQYTLTMVQLDGLLLSGALVDDIQTVIDYLAAAGA